MVTPGAPVESYLWHKVAGTHLTVGGAGGRMPKPTDPPLTALELATVEAWLLGGALT